MVDVYTQMKADSYRSQTRSCKQSRPDSLLVLRGHQGGSGGQRLPKVQDRQAPIRGPRGRWNNAQGRGLHRGRGRRRRSAGPGGAAAAPPAGAAADAPPPAGRSLQLRLRLQNQSPAQPERLGDAVVRRLKADAD
jgi:hypothetical protein